MKKIKFIFLFVFSLVLSFFIGIESFSFLENRVHDLYLQNSKQITNDVVIIGIDNESIEKIGRFPWDRDVYAKLVDNLTEGEAAAVGFDLIFSEVQGEEDHTFAKSIEENGSVLLATYGEFNDQITEDTKSISADFFYYPNDILMESNPHLGFINTILEDDNVVRRALPYIYDVETDSYKTSFNYELYKMYASKNGIPIDELSKSYFARPYINYYGRIGSIETIPFHMALDREQIPPEYFENKIILVGMTASGGEDIYYTPAGAMYGVEIHANFINNLIIDNYKTTLLSRQYVHIFGDKFLDITLFLGCILAELIYIFISLRTKNNFRKSLYTLLFIMAYLIFVKVSFEMGYLVMMIYPIMIIVFSYFIDIIIDYYKASREKKTITNIFSRYMSKELVNKVVNDGYENMKLGGTRKYITALFIDVRGFTTMSETLEPEEVMSIINEYLSMATECIFKYHGLLDKYTGDGLMALFNVPYDVENHELLAVKSALEIQEKSIKIQEALLEKYGKDVKIGIGINCGDAIIGNIGSVRRMDYTAIGDTINTAARLESNAKGGQVLISEEVYKKIENQVIVNPIGELSLKGKANAINTYEVTNTVEGQKNE